MRSTITLFLAAGAALSLLAGPAAATEVVNRRLCTVQTLENCLDGVGGGVTSLDSLRVTSVGRGTTAAESEERARQQVRANILGTRGAAAGAAGGGWSVWGSAGFAIYESTVATAPYEADTLNLLIGADRFFGERVVAGFTLGHENTDTDTLYNGGGQDRDGLLVGVYGAFLADDVFSVDVAAGYGAMDTEETRIDPGTSTRSGPATPGATLVGSYEADRAFFTANLNAVKAFGSWVLGGRLGMLHAVESQDRYTETGGGGARSVGNRHIDLTQAYASIDVGYSAGAFEPYVLLGYRNDLGRDDGNKAGGLPGGVRTQPSDDDEWQGGLGLRYFGASGATGSVEWLRTEGRSRFDEDTVNLTVRVPF